MSYSTYLQNKLAAERKVVDVRKPTDASQYIHKKRLESNQIFFADGRGVGSLAMDTSRPDGTPLLQHPSASFRKGTTRPAAASEYTSYRGARGIQTDAPYQAGGRKELICCEAPDVDGTKYASASDFIRSKACCEEAHNANELGGPLFVDNTIRLSAMVPEMVSGGCCEHKANHTHSEGIHPPTHPSAAHGKRSEIMRSPPEFQNQGVGGKRAGAYYNPRSKYVENKHGNDLNVNPRRVPTKFVLDPHAPAHLKINDPTFANVKP